MINQLPQNVRLIAASCLAALIIFAWQIFFVDPVLQQETKEQKVVTNTLQTNKIDFSNLEDREQLIDRAVNKNSRITFNNNVIKGSINLVGARLDDVILLKYHQDIASNSPNVVLMSPSKTQDTHFIEFGWLSSTSGIDLPNNNTQWTANKPNLQLNEILTLSYINPQKVEFYIDISLDENYMFKFKQRVINNSSHDIKLTNYGLISKASAMPKDSNMIIHEGAIGVLDNKLVETKYEDIISKEKIEFNNASWLGFSDKYWLSALVPVNSNNLTDKLSYSLKNGQPRFQAAFNTTMPLTVNPKEQVEWSEILTFSGAKELDLLDHYETKHNIKLFDRAVDFGILYFITKPIFQLLHYFYDLVGNFGIAILLLTVIIKILLFPLAYKGFKGMNRLKDLQPKMAQLKEKYVDDAPGFQRALIDLYRQEKVNPMGGCLPILLQIPIFFALYKVLYVTIEMRHAPFFGWINDLSAPDHLTITNLFGLLPFTPPPFLIIGIFPILMALTMFIQQRLNPEPSDPVQAKVMKFLPLMFLFMFSSFPSGLVIYWTWSNILSILQQVIIKYMTRSK